MIVDLPAAYAGIKHVSVRTRNHRGAELPSALSVLIAGRTEIALEREWRLTMAIALRQLPPGNCMTFRDAKGRTWSIGPANQPVATKLTGGTVDTQRRSR